ncbi:DUF488 domain-containing protein [Nostoc sp. FACHB-888]|uniref:DUF488 domain-containing protein n=1 Tax=Nostoc sp. FACHB-888 TaxID=2692842 RepID=UPI001686F26E|nr:DUF488 domain-containing protein [Nostoc sp. FACHB-888]MBD2248248.1 DUF488 domain-containing protein [Nostoc sp. FACHB-888]
MKLFTIGHSNHSIETFIGLLNKHNVTAVADVRSHPYSRNFPHFNLASLRKTLKTANIAYIFLGDNLGARPNERSCYVEGMARYDLIAATEAFTDGLARLIKGAERHQITLMCAEHDPIVCHRAILVCQHLRKTGLETQHILKSSDLESHQHLEERLLKLHHLEQMLSPSEKSDDAYKSAEQLSLFDTKLYSAHARQMDVKTTFHFREELIQKAYKLQGDRIAYVEK